MPPRDDDPHAAYPGFVVRDPRRRGRGYRSAHCARCRQWPAHCICRQLEPIECGVEVVVVMHHFEFPKPTNTALLAVHKLRSASVRVRGARGVPFDASDLAGAGTALLYPSDEAREIASAARIRRLVVPDGNWSQTRRMIRRDPNLRALPHVRLPAGQVGRYPLRKRCAEGQICTLEAIARALGRLGEPHVQGQLEQVLKAAVRGWQLRRGVWDAQEALQDP